MLIVNLPVHELTSTNQLMLLALELGGFAVHDGSYSGTSSGALTHLACSGIGPSPYPLLSSHCAAGPS
jgi:hypothetical protein